MNLHRHHPAFERHLGKSIVTAGFRSITRLQGDASTRSYFRLVRKRGSSCIVALYPNPIDLKDFDFLQVRNLLAGAGFHVPAIMDMMPEQGILILEDLGDLTAQRFLAKAGSKEKEDFYDRAITLLAGLHRAFRGKGAGRNIAMKRAFTQKKFREELALFYRSFIEGFIGKACSEQDEKTLFSGFDWIARRSLRGDKVFCHRDFHVRNILIYKRRLYLIDFQDARLGPPTYDPVSLLFDSYFRLGDRLRKSLLEHFVQRIGADYARAEEFRKALPVMALQRNLKAIGTFATQAVLKRNRTYLRYIPRTMQYVWMHLRVCPELDAFGKVLKRLVNIKKEGYRNFPLLP